MSTPVTATTSLSNSWSRAYAWFQRQGVLPQDGFGGAGSRPLAYARFLNSWRKYQRLDGAETLRISDSYPQLDDHTRFTQFDPHYFYQGIWLARKLASAKYVHHYDIASDHRLIGVLSCLAPVTYVDIRPYRVHVPGLSAVSGSIVSLPFRDSALSSLSCLHVAEHVGLGRYGDELDPLGTRKAAAELTRVLEPDGHLYFSVPVGRPRVEFNAHRVHAPRQILHYFDKLQLREFAAVDDHGTFMPDADIAAFDTADYACGMFWFQRGQD